MHERPTHKSPAHESPAHEEPAHAPPRAARLSPKESAEPAEFTESAEPAEPAGPNSPTSGPRWLWGAALVLAAAAFTVAGLVVAGWRPLLDGDAAVARWFHVRALAHPDWTQTNRILTDWVWDPVTMRILVGVAAIGVWLRGEALLALWCLGTSAAGTGVQQGLKALLDRERPHWEHPVDSAQFSAMPSGHAVTAAVTCVLVVWLVQRSGASRRLVVLVLAPACVSVAGVCVTRIALGVHWLTDTVVGTLLGVAMVAASAGLWDSLTVRRARRAEPESG